MKLFSATQLMKMRFIRENYIYEKIFVKSCVLLRMFIIVRFLGFNQVIQCYSAHENAFYQ